MTHYVYEDFVRAADVIRSRVPQIPEIGLVLGSGLGQLADEVQHPVIMDYQDIPGWPVSTVAGHMGRLVIGELCGKYVLVQQGRVHFYEGYNADQLVFAIRVMLCLGIKKLVVTNAAGGVAPEISGGDVMLITDHIGFPAMSGYGQPLSGKNYDQFGTRFPDMSKAYDREYCGFARDAANKQKIDLKEGVYTWLSGPSYETPAEIRFLRAIGTSAVGMSTVPEVIVAHHGGMRVLGFSGVTNQCSVTGDTETTHEEVLVAADVIGPKIIKILTEVLPRM